MRTYRLNDVTALVAHDSQNIWVAQNKTIHRLSERDLSASATIVPDRLDRTALRLGEVSRLELGDPADQPYLITHRGGYSDVLHAHNLHRCGRACFGQYLDVATTVNRNYEPAVFADYGAKQQQIFAPHASRRTRFRHLIAVNRQQPRVAAAVEVLYATMPRMQHWLGLVSIDLNNLAVVRRKSTSDDLAAHTYHTRLDGHSLLAVYLRATSHGIALVEDNYAVCGFDGFKLTTLTPPLSTEVWGASSSHPTSVDWDGTHTVVGCKHSVSLYRDAQLLYDFWPFRDRRCSVRGVCLSRDGNTFWCWTSRELACIDIE